MNTWVKFGRLVFILIVILIGTLHLQAAMPANNTTNITQNSGSSPAAAALNTLLIKGRAPKTGYTREMFSSGWGTIGNCDARNYILARDMQEVVFVDNTCKVATGTLQDPYTATTIHFVRGPDSSGSVQIDHVVALSDAWQKGAQQLSPTERFQLANDPLELLAVDGKTNQAKGDGDAASWLPPNKSFRCDYIARQIAVKQKYKLWVTVAEYNAMAKILINCPNQKVPSI